MSKVKVTILWLFLVVSAGVYLWHNLIIVADIEQFMPSSNNNKTSQILLDQSQQGASANLIFMQISKGSPDKLAIISNELKIILEDKTKQFEFVVNSQINADVDKYKNFAKYRYLITKPSSFSSDSLRQFFQKILSDFRADMPQEIIKYLLTDPQRVFINYLSSIQPKMQIKEKHGVWFVDDKSVLLLIQLKSNLNIDAKQNAIRTIQQAFKKTNATIGAESLLLGQSIIALDVRGQIKDTIKHASFMLVGVMLLVFLFFYRSLNLLFLAILPLTISIIITMAITQVIFGQIHGIVLAFGITALGVCLDYPLHLFSHINKNEGPSITFTKIFPILKFGALTSIFAYISLVGTGFSGLNQLAVFSATGLLIALIVSRYLLPLWVKNRWINKRIIPIHNPLSLKTKLLSSVFLIVLPLTILLMQNNIFASDITQINPAPVQTRQADNNLRKSLGADDANHLFLISGDNVRQVLTATEKIQQHLQILVDKNIIDGLLSASDILPSKVRQEYYQSLLPNKKILENNVTVAMKGLPFKKSTFEQFVVDASSSKTKKPIDYETMKKSIMSDKLDSMLFKRDGDWYSIIRVTNVKDEEKFNSWVENSEVKSYYYSIRKTADTIMNNYLQSTWTRLLVMLSLLILLILYLARVQKQRIWLIIPILSGVLLSLAVQVLMGNSINIFHLLSLLLVIGLGFDYGLFFNQKWNDRTQLQQRTHAITISLITTIATFSVLALSNINVLNSIGQIVIVGTFSSFITSKFIVTPSVSKVI